MEKEGVKKGERKRRERRREEEKDVGVMDEEQEEKTRTKVAHTQNMSQQQPRNKKCSRRNKDQNFTWSKISQPTKSSQKKLFAGLDIF